MEEKMPWLKNYCDVPFNLEYPKMSVSEAVLSTASLNPRNIALSFMGKKVSYKCFSEKIKRLSVVFFNMGIKKGDRVILCLPNILQAVYAFYALNRVGAVPCMVHPLSAEAELEYYIKKCKAKLIIALDSNAEKLKSALKKTDEITLILTSLFDELCPFLGMKSDSQKHGINVLYWQSVIKNRECANIYISSQKSTDTAVIMFTGGTTGVCKAVELTNLNLNALAIQTEAMCHADIRGKKMLSVLPLFHGFGLGICIHTALVCGAESILVPRFDSKKVVSIIKRHKPNFMAGVPAMYEAMLREKSFVNADLSMLEGVFSGGDRLSDDLKNRFDKFLENRGAKVKIRQGYGETECVAAVCLMPVNFEKKDSVGIPYPDTYIKICAVGTCDELSFGEIGEICISGKTVMKGYLDDKSETDKVLKIHRDGRLWLHTGDLGYMDVQGFVYFTQRIKRLIVSNGYNIYPYQLEKSLSSHPLVKECCAVGVHDDVKSQTSAVFVVLKNDCCDTDNAKKELYKHLCRQVVKYALPEFIIFTPSLPKTSLGKTDFSELTRLAKEYKDKNAAEH